MASYIGRAALLGEPSLERASRYGPPVRVLRDAPSWIASGFDGVVVVEPRRAARVFLDFGLTGISLAAEDDRHARELAAARAELVDRAPAILVPDLARRAAA